MPFAQPIRTIKEALLVRQVSPRWFIGRRVVGTKQLAYFAKTRAELEFKDRAARLQALTDQFYPGQRVRYQRTSAEPFGGKVYTICMMAAQHDGTPIAWLNGVSGAVPLERLIPETGSEDLQP